MRAGVQDAFDAHFRLALIDQNANVLPFGDTPIALAAEGPIEIIGPQTAVLRGGLGGTFVKTTGEPGKAALTLTAEGLPPVRIEFTVETEQEDAHGG